MADPPNAASALCAKLTTNINHHQWNSWVSPGHRLRPGLPGPAPGEVAIGGGPPNSERRGQLAHRLTGGGEPAQAAFAYPG